MYVRRSVIGTRTRDIQLGNGLSTNLTWPPFLFFLHLDCWSPAQPRKVSPAYDQQL